METITEFRRDLFDRPRSILGIPHLPLMMPRPDLEKEIRRFKRDMTLQLLLQQGPFWQRIAQARDLFGFTGLNRQTAVPPSDDPPLPDPPRITGTDQPAFDAALVFRQLHDDLIPLRVRVGDAPQSALAWQPFLINCVHYEPPPEYLLHYALTGGPVLPESVEERATEREGRVTLTLPPGVVLHVEPRDVVNGEAAYWNAAIRLLADRLGIDYSTVVSPALLAIRQEEFETLNRARDDGLRGAPAALAIPVHETTTRGDVDNAFRAITATHPRRPKRGPEPIDDLTAVQCVMWRRRCNATNAQIAETLNKIVGNNEHGRPARSVTARNYIKRGEEILAQAGKDPEYRRLCYPQTGGNN